MKAPVALEAATDRDEWNALVLGTPHATPFHTWEFLELAARDWALGFEPMLAIHEGEAIGGVPQLVDHRHGLRWANHLALVNYIGPAVASEHLHDTLAAMSSRERLRTMRERAEIRIDPADVPEAPGWNVRPVSSMVVPLAERTVDDLERQASRGFRRTAKAADRFRLTVDPSSEEDLRELLPRLEREVFGRQGTTAPYRDDTYWTVFEAFERRGLAHAATAHVDGVAAGITIVLVHGDVAYEWVSAADVAFRRERPSMAMRRALILRAHSDGHREYDMLGGSTAGITDFKRSVGARDKPYVVLERGHRL